MFAGKWGHFITIRQVQSIYLIYIANMAQVAIVDF